MASVGSYTPNTEFRIPDFAFGSFCGRKSNTTLMGSDTSDVLSTGRRWKELRRSRTCRIRKSSCSSADRSGRPVRTSATTTYSLGIPTYYSVARSYTPSQPKFFIALSGSCEWVLQ
jgi:hypothetical protein